jgi:fructan beta-fructosidase
LTKKEGKTMKKTAIRVAMFIVLITAGVFAQTEKGDILIADFEGRDYGDWKATGNAFGHSPRWFESEFMEELSGFEGNGLATSYHNWDEPTGTLTSPEFKIERDYIIFLISGGDHEEKTCMQLIVDGEIVRQKTGQESNLLDWESWDVSDLKGKKARIRLIDDHRGDWGHITVDHIYQSHKKIEILENVERAFTFDKKYLNLPVKNGASLRLIHVIIDDTIVREFEISLAPDEPDFWVYQELNPFQGKKATVRINKLIAKNRNGFDSIYQDDTFPGEDHLYKEKYRPQFHFSSKRGWNNDPNGMMYYDGEYHLFYQHNPFGWPWGNMTWGHAVSKDMLHWEELGDALHPDDLGTMFSGSGVVDWLNTTGFQTGDVPPLICIYTNAGSENPWSEGKPFTQGIAYSNDRGRTWSKYEGNPVQGHINQGNRDPKVIWWEETQEWAIVLYLIDSRMAFFRSEDLKRWELQSILDSFHECPELFQLPVDGDEKNKKWILYGAAGDYFIGDFDGSQFTPEGEAIKYNYGNAFYASQTFSDIPKEDGRRIQIGWATIATPGMPFNQMMNFPVELTLRTTPDGIRMCPMPAKEIEKLHKNEKVFKKKNINPGINLLKGFSGDYYDIDADIAIADAGRIGFRIRDVEIVFDVKEQKLMSGEESAPLRIINGRIQLRILVDKTSIEVYANNGEIFMPLAAFPEDDVKKDLELFTEGGTAKVKMLAVREIKSIW